MWGKRIYRGLLSSKEQRLIQFGIPFIPRFVTPDHLSILAVVGALLAGISIVMCWLSAGYILGFALGLVLHWFGDSFDGALARSRKIERPKAGLLIDRGADLLSYFLIIGGLGFSPYLSLIPALLLLVGVLTNAVYAILHAITDKKQIVGIGGLGGTEGRLFLLAWVVVCHFTGYANAVPPFEALSTVEILTFIALAVAICGYAVSLLKNIATHSRLEIAERSASTERDHLSDPSFSNSKTAELVTLALPTNARSAVRLVRAPSTNYRRMRV